MKLITTFFLTPFIPLVLSCYQGREETKNIHTTLHSHPGIDSPLLKNESKSVAQDDLLLFKQLYPIDILHPESKNSFKKYGIEFSGICYACDLAEIKIDKGLFHFVNVCDSNQIYQIKEFTYRRSDSSLIIKTKNNEFVLKSIEKEPIFELNIKGAPLLLKNKRIAKYYTQKSLIDQFESHDCGDFQG